MNIRFQPDQFSLVNTSQTVVSFVNSVGRLVGLYQTGQPVELHPLHSETDPAEIRYACDGWLITDRLELLSPGLYRCQREWENLSGQAQEVVLLAELHRPSRVTSFIIPAVSYNGNGWGNGQEPKGLVDPASLDGAPWVFGGDRTSIPACSMTEGEGIVIALYTSEELANQSACSLHATPNGGMIQRIWWPLQEQPRMYSGRDLYGPAIHNTVLLKAGKSCSREFFISIHPALDGPNDFSAILNSAWAQFYRYVPPKLTPEQAWQFSIRFAKEILWEDRDDFKGFILGRILRDGQWVRPNWNLYEIGWCGQNSGYASMLLADFLLYGDEDSWQKGAAALDFWAEHGRYPNGLFDTHFHEHLAGNQNPRLDTCNLGGGACNYFLAADLADRAGYSKPLWRELALGVCDFFTEHMLPDGRFGRYWRASGELMEADGTVGCWMVQPLAKAYRITGLEKYLSAAIRGYRYYADNDLKAFRATAGALDTDSIDKEGACPLLIAGLDLYEITGDSYFLHQSEKAAQYLATWQWHYTLSYPEGSAADQMGYNTFGGTSVSVQHHCIDPWGVYIAAGWLRLGQITKKRVWQERAAAAWRHGTMGVSDGSLTIDGIPRFAGGQDEGFMHTRWGLSSPGSVSTWQVAWPGAFRLHTLYLCPNWDVFR